MYFLVSFPGRRISRAQCTGISDGTRQSKTDGVNVVEQRLCPPDTEWGPNPQNAAQHLSTTINL